MSGCLFQFIAKVAQEVERADMLHGDWRGDDSATMITRICGEVREVGAAAAAGDRTGPHGMETELVQVAATAFKMFREVRRANLPQQDV